MIFFQGEFSAFDYGTKGNLKVYGTKKSHRYNLNLVTAPVYILWSKSDLYVDQKVYSILKIINSLYNNKLP